MRTALGWFIASGYGLGSEQFVGNFDLDAAAKGIEEVVRTKELSSHTFIRDFSSALDEPIKRDLGDFPSTGPFLGTLWKVATRTVRGQEHPGFVYLY